MSKERPILFSAPMVRALLDGSKTQTRRVISDRHLRQISTSMGPRSANWSKPMPYGQPGDRLWVRENFDFLPSGGPDEPQACEIVYWATGSSEPRQAPEKYNPMLYGHQKIRPNIHMPRWASRILLEITAVRVERLQDITSADAKAEGCKHNDPCDHKRQLCHEIGCEGPDYRPAYKTLWQQINGPRSWEANPWVWVVEFKQLKGATQ